MHNPEHTLYYDVRNRYRIAGRLGGPVCADDICAGKHPLR